MGKRADMRRYFRLRHERRMRPLVRASVEWARANPLPFLGPAVPWSSGATAVPAADIMDLIATAREKYGEPFEADPGANP